MDEKTFGELWVIEYNWRKKYFHFEPIKERLIKNLSQLIRSGRPNTEGWVLVYLCKQDEIHEAIEKLEEFLIRGRKIDRD